MFVLYEESGQFKAATIKSQTDATLQIEASSGKRSKIKRANCILEFSDPTPETVLEQAEQLGQDIDAAFLWEVAPEGEFEVHEIAEQWFGHTPSPLETTALLLRLHDAPLYFHRRGKGRYRAAPSDILQAALAAQEKKQQQAQQLQTWADELLAGELPPIVAENALGFLIRPDKNLLAYKAVALACEQSGQSIEQLLLSCKAWPNALALHRAKFLGTYFGKGIEFGGVDALPSHDDLPLADVTAYSVDDISTTEIDDALSVSPLADGWLRLGVHVAAPALGVTRDSALDLLARQRMSTVYLPGQKIPMQPEEVSFMWKSTSRREKFAATRLGWSALW
jgi:exoribonuclease II